MYVVFNCLKLRARNCVREGYMTAEMKVRLKEAGIDFDGILARLPGREDLIYRLLGKFLKEPCYNGLVESMQKQDYEAAFAHAHTLKGVTANLEMTRLNKATCTLVEKLRSKETDGIEADFEQVKKEYKQVVDIIQREVLTQE